MLFLVKLLRFHSIISCSCLCLLQSASLNCHKNETFGNSRTVNKNFLFQWKSSRSMQGVLFVNLEFLPLFLIEKTIHSSRECDSRQYCIFCSSKGEKQVCRLYCKQTLEWGDCVTRDSLDRVIFGSMIKHIKLLNEVLNTQMVQFWHTT